MVVVRTPCRLLEETRTRAPSSARFCWSTTRPAMAPVVDCAVRGTDQNAANLAISSGRAEVGMADSPVAAYIVKQSNGQFELTGKSLVDHFAWKREMETGEPPEELAKFCSEAGLPAPLSEADRKKSLKGLKAPEV